MSSQRLSTQTRWWCSFWLGIAALGAGVAGSIEPAPSGWRYGRKTLLFAAILTAGMFGWQAWQLVDSYQIVAEREAGECPTRAVEAAYSAGERLNYLAEEIELGVFRWGPTAPDTALPELGRRFDATDAELAAALEEAGRLSREKVLAAVKEMELAHGPLADHVHRVIGLVEDGESELAGGIAGGPEFQEARQSYETALSGMWQARSEHLVVQLEDERRNEVVSIGIALGLFVLALGAWILFIRRIRHSRALLEKEERQRKLAEQQLLQAQKMDALGLLAGGIAHDFNNLLTAIWGSATSSKEQLASDHPAISGLERIEEAAEQANGVVRGLLTFSRRSGSAKMPVEMGALMDATTRILRPMLPAATELLVEHPDEPCLWLSADATQIEQVLMNLALNAHEAMPDGGRIVMRGRRSDTQSGSPTVVVEVTDTGEGMPDDIMSRVFEPFFTTRPPGQGTGLGLSIVHGIVTDHSGSIDVASSLGQGSSFTVEFPAISAPVEAHSDTVPGSSAVSYCNELVLLVEDHQHVREIIAESLEAAGFGVVQATNGAEFLAAFARDRDLFTLLVADVDIPPPSGVDCVRQLREQGVMIPAMVITGTPAPGLEDELEGIAVVVRKPFTMARLVEVATSLVEVAPV